MLSHLRLKIGNEAAKFRGFFRQTKKTNLRCDGHKTTIILLLETCEICYKHMTDCAVTRLSRKTEAKLIQDQVRKNLHQW